MDFIDQAEDLFRNSDKPDIGKLQNLFDRAYNAAARLRSYEDDFSDVRFCNWPGRATDGKKHGSETTPAFPWNGASDLRVFAIDDIINKTVAAVMRAIDRARLIGVPRNGVDFERAQAITGYLECYLKGLQNVRREKKLAFNWCYSYGASALMVGWKQEKILRKKFITAQEAGDAGENVLRFLAGEEIDDGTQGLAPEEMQALSPEARPYYREALDEICDAYGLSKSEGAKTLKELLKGSAEITVEAAGKNEAFIKALRVGTELILPEDVDDIEDAPYCFLVEYLSASEVVKRAEARDWDKAFVSELWATSKTYQERQRRRRELVYDKSATSCANRYKVITAYYSCVDSDGVLARRYCVFHPDIKRFAECGVLDLYPVRYPFVLLSAEDAERDFFNARGFCEIAEGWQQEIKVQKDLRIDAASLAINPPKFYKAGTQITQFKPGAFIPMRGSDMKVLEEYKTAPNLNASVEIENSIASQMVSYFGGAAGEGENPDAAAQKAAIIEDAFAAMGKVIKHLQWLCAQYAPEQVAYFALDNSESEAIQIERGEFAADFDVVFSYDYNDENFQRFVQKFEVAAKFMQTFDRNGDVKGLQFMRRLLSGLFPSDARSFIGAQEETSTREILETQNDLAAIYSSQPVNAPEKCNAALRLQLVGQWLQSPSIQARLQSDEDFAAAVQTYMAQLQFQMQQNQNAVIGRMGAAPARGESSNLEVLNSGQP